MGTSQRTSVMVFLGLLYDSVHLGDIFLRKRRAFYRLHGVTTQMIALSKP
jgi:hypothetical protein